MQKMSADPLTTCPECKAETFVKQLTAPGFQLKGSGWYATDFKGSGSKPPAKESESSTKPASADAAAPAKTETAAAPAAKPAAESAS